MTRGKHAIVISRDWHNPTIKIDVTEEGISIGMSLADFLAAIAEEYGNPARTITKSQHLARLRVAADAVTASMKNETVRVM